MSDLHCTIGSVSVSFEALRDLIKLPSQIEKLRKELLAVMSKQDEAIAKFKTSVTEQLTAFGVSLDNIATDEANLLKQIQDLPVTAENQAALDGIVASLTAMSTRTREIADSVPDIAPVS